HSPHTALFIFMATAPTELSTLSLHDALPICDLSRVHLNGAIIASAATSSGRGYFMVGRDGGIFAFGDARFRGSTGNLRLNKPVVDRKSTRLNSSHVSISYAVFCLKKKTKTKP